MVPFSALIKGTKFQRKAESRAFPDIDSHRYANYIRTVEIGRCAAVTETDDGMNDTYVPDNPWIG